jgi:hypothetical protein
MNNGTLLSGTIAGILPDNFVKLDTMPPVAILRQLAYELGRKTRNIVEGDVRTRTSERDLQRTYIYHVFELVAPALDGLRYELFRIMHHEVSELYPVLLTWNAALLEPDENVRTLRINDEAELIARLHDLFASAKVRQTIQSLITQSTAVVPSGLGDEDEE